MGFFSSKLVVEFCDGSVVRGSTVHAYNPADEAFYLVPEAGESENEGILVELATVEAVYTVKEYENKLRTAHQTARKHPGQTTLSPGGEAESKGDMFFGAGNYSAALEHYTSIAEQHGETESLQHRITSATFEIGIQHLRHHRYPDSLACMETVLEREPHHLKAQRTVNKLRVKIENTKRLMEMFARKYDLHGADSADDAGQGRCQC